MKKVHFFILAVFALVGTCIAGLPPTTSQITGDSNNITTFNYQFPNFTGTHTGTTVSLGVNSLSGGGTGQSTQQLAINALAGSQTSGQYLRGNGTNILMSTIQAADLPSLSGIYANINLSNLGTTAVNQHLIPGSANSFNLGSSAAPWNSLFINNILDPSNRTSIQANSRTLIDSSGVNQLGWDGLVTIYNTLQMNGSSSGSITHKASTTGSAYTITWPGAQGGASTFLKNNGSGVLSWATAGSATTTAPTVQRFVAAGTGTYTAPNPAPLYLEVFMVGGGGGGGGGGVGAGNGTSGTSTFFSTFVCNGGTLGFGALGGSPGTGGTTSLGGGTAVVAVAGGDGQPGASNAAFSAGGAGGVTAWAGNGSGGSNGGSATNSKSGTGSGGSAGAAGAGAATEGQGGGAGAYIDGLIYNVTAGMTISYQVGAKGTGGVAGTGGGGGGDASVGSLIVVEHYQ